MLPTWVFFLRCGGLWNWTDSVAWSLFYPVIWYCNLAWWGMTDFDVDTQDILSLLFFVTGEWLWNVTLLLDHRLLRRRRELALVLMGGVHKHCSTLMKTTSEKKEEERKRCIELMYSCYRVAVFYFFRFLISPMMVWKSEKDVEERWSEEIGLWFPRKDRNLLEFWYHTFHITQSDATHCPYKNTDWYILKGDFGINMLLVVVRDT